MRFQPGSSRYFGQTPRPVSPATNSILPFLQAGNDRLGRLPVRMATGRSTKPTSFVIHRKEQKEITKNLLKTPNYVPAAATKGLKTLAKKIMANKDLFSKEERVFAQATLHSDQAIKDSSRQKKFVQGEAEALAAIGDRHVVNPYSFTHHSAEVARQTLKTVAKEASAPSDKKSVADRRASLGSRAYNREEPPAVGAPATGWVAPVPLGDSATPGAEGNDKSGGDWGTPFIPTTAGAGIRADSLHRGAVSADNNSLAGGGVADLLIISDRLTEADVLAWKKVLPWSIIRLRSTAAGLIKSLAQPPRMIAIDNDGGLDLEKVIKQAGALPIAIFTTPNLTISDGGVSGAGIKQLPEAISLVGIKRLLSAGGRLGNGPQNTAASVPNQVKKTDSLPDLSHVDEGLPF